MTLIIKQLIIKGVILKDTSLKENDKKEKQELFKYLAKMKKEIEQKCTENILSKLESKRNR